MPPIGIEVSKLRDMERWCVLTMTAGKDSVKNSLDPGVFFFYVGIIVLIC